MEGAVTVLKAGMGTGSLIFGKPMLNKGAAVGRKTCGVGLLVGLLLSTGPKIFCSYSCNCWETAITIRRNEIRKSYKQLPPETYSPQ